MNRKEFVISFMSIILAALTPSFMGGKLRKLFIRPPGSFDELFFPRLCIRCGQCIRTCPANCLKPIRIEDSIVSWGTPGIFPREKGCILCQNCGRICPANVIRVVNKELIKIGTAEIYKDRCLVWTQQKECLVCLEYCPAQAIYLDYKKRPVVSPGICTGCGLCEENCPVLGEQAAIRVNNRGERRVRIDGKYV